MVKYKYDAWGNIISQTGGSLADIYPYRYRGYRYDVETGLYYLQSRYYDPAIGRFISADGLLGETGNLVTHNMYAYCGNNPVMHIDPNGEAFLTIMLITAGSLALKAGASLSLVAMAKIALGIAAGVSLKYILEQVKEESEKADKKYTVYALKDNTGEIVYVGRVLTENYAARMAHHEKTGRGTPVIRIDNLTYMQCRGLEQAGILAHSTLGKENKINGISAINPMGQHYNIAAKAVRYFRNQIENEYLNLFDKKG